MSLQVWLPLNRDLSNYGLCNVSTRSISSASVTTNRGGKLGNCLSLSSDGQAVSLDSYMDVCSTYTRYSMSAWVYMSSTATNHSSSILSSGDWNSGSSQFCFGLYGYSSNGYWKILVPNKSSWSDGIDLSSSIKLNTWYNICITYDGSTTRGYVNGEYVGSYARGGITSSSNSKNLYIGCATYYSGFTLKGSINDVRIYDHCLSAKEVKEISKGLVCHYKLADPYIESTTNLYSGWSTSCYNGVTGKYNYGTSTDMYYDNLDGVIRVRMGTSNLDAWPYVFFNNITPPSNGEYRTLTFDYYPTINDKVNFYSYNTSGTVTWIANGVKGAGGNIPVKLNSWNHISVTIKNTGSSNSGFGYMRIGLEKHTSSTSNYWLFKNIQIESKDHSTGYVSAGTSRNPDTEYDVSGYKYNGTVSESLTYVPDSPRYSGCYYFNSTSKRITLPAINMSGFSNSFSISWWGKAPSYSGLMYWGFSDGNRLNFYSGMYCNTGDGSNNPYYKPNTTITVSTPSVDTWHHFVMVGDGSSNKLYMDGGLYGVAKTYKGITGSTIVINGWDSSTQYKTNGYISDFRIYSTALSVSDVKELYNTSASVDKNGNMYAYEFKEE